MRLSVLAWDHARATAPLATCSGAWERLTGERFVVRTRSLRSFGDEVPAAGGSDLVLIDHPHIGRAAAEGSILPLDDLLDGSQLAAIAADSAGPSHASYQHEGRQWAIAIDASCQALALAGPTLSGLPSRPTWDDVVALALRHPRKVALPLQPAHAISALLSMLAAREPIARARLASTDAVRWATSTLAAVAAAGPAEAFGWEPPEALARLASGELICIPLVFAFVGYDVIWRQAPAHDLHGKPGSILGGVGAAVLSGSSDPSAAARLAAWLGSSETQLDFVRHAGGQPATRSAWTAPGADAMFTAVLPTLERSQTRPRDPWWPDFQRDSGELIARALSVHRDPLLLADDLAHLYHDHREATS